MPPSTGSMSQRQVPDRSDWFDICQARNRISEGGLVDDPDDPGRITNHGISLNWAERALGFDRKDIVDLSYEDARELYRVHWWNQYQCERLPDVECASIYYQMLINWKAGIPQQRLQWAIVACRVNVKVDGVIGPITLAAAASIQPGFLEVALRAEWGVRYRYLAKMHPRKMKFINGWLSRAYFDSKEQVLFRFL